MISRAAGSLGSVRPLAEIPPRADMGHGTGQERDRVCRQRVKGVNKETSRLTCAIYSFSLSCVENRSTYNSKLNFRD